jgi:predicted NAD-dependent protein-ADP-ribosyltransferase YbiA (DUF1768 family)/uncharacterized protein YjbI with pentapeptide repeats
MPRKNIIDDSQMERRCQTFLSDYEQGKEDLSNPLTGRSFKRSTKGKRTSPLIRKIINECNKFESLKNSCERIFVNDMSSKRSTINPISKRKISSKGSTFKNLVRRCKTIKPKQQLPNEICDKFLDQVDSGKEKIKHPINGRNIIRGKKVYRDLINKCSDRKIERDNSKSDTPQDQDREDTPQDQDREDTPQDQDREDTPQDQDREDTPQDQDREDTPQDQDREDTPQDQDREDTPQDQDREDTPQDQDREDTPQDQDREDTPQDQDREDTPQDQDLISKCKAFMKSYNSNDQYLIDPISKRKILKGKGKTKYWLKLCRKYKDLIDGSDDSEKERLEKERLEKERLENERLENERLEKERLENERLEKERLENERLEKERLENERLENERLEKERLENERLEKERLEKERLEKERLENERLEKERLEKERLENERLEKERLENERLENERLEKERLENERLENERLEKERLEKERLEKERLEKERLEKERLENERLEKERLEKERLEKERLEKERLEREKERMFQETNNIIKFYDSKSNYFEFSSLYQQALMINGIKWNSLEHYFQAEKFNNENSKEYYNLISQADTPQKAIEMGSQSLSQKGKKWYVNKNNKDIGLMSDIITRYKDIKIRDDWDDVKERGLENGVRVKFETSARLKRLLMSTGDSILIYESPNDAYMGTGKNNEGENVLGMILMKIRKEFSEKKVVQRTKGIKNFNQTCYSNAVIKLLKNISGLKFTNPDVQQIYETDEENITDVIVKKIVGMCNLKYGKQHDAVEMLQKILFDVDNKDKFEIPWYMSPHVKYSDVCLPLYDAAGMIKKNNYSDKANIYMLYETDDRNYESVQEMINDVYFIIDGEKLDFSSDGYSPDDYISSGTTKITLSEIFLRYETTKISGCIREIYEPSAPYLIISPELIRKDTTKKGKKKTKLSVSNVLRPIKFKNGSSYTPVSFIVHVGDSIIKGHYINYSVVDGVWYKFDDDLVTEVNLEDITIASPAVILYSLDSVHANEDNNVPETIPEMVENDEPETSVSKMPVSEKEVGGVKYIYPEVESRRIFAEQDSENIGIPKWMPSGDDSNPGIYKMNVIDMLNN